MEHAEIKIEWLENGFRVSIQKGTETIAIDECDDGTYHLWVTQRNGGWSIAVFRFDEDRVAVVSATDLSGVTEEKG